MQTITNKEIRKKKNKSASTSRRYCRLRRPAQKRLLERLYYNPPPTKASSFAAAAATSSWLGSVQSLLRAAQMRNSQIGRKDVEEFLAAQPAYTRHRKAVRRFPRMPTLPVGLHTHWQADLADLQRLKRWNNGFAYLLVCIDVLSRQLFVEPLRRKTAADVESAFRAIFKRSGFIPWRLYTDQGREFTAESVQQLFNEHQITHRLMFTSPQFHCGMAERVIRTLKEKIYRWFTAERTNRWVDIVQTAVASINASPHRSLGDGMAPRDVNFANAEQLRKKIWARIESAGKLSDSVRVRRQFKPNDVVRIERAKSRLEKGYLPRFTDALFRIVDVHTTTRPTTYTLCDLDTGASIEGRFYAQDMCRTRIEEK